MREAIRKTLTAIVEEIFAKVKMIVEKEGGHQPVLFLLHKDKLEVIDFSEYINNKPLVEAMIKAYQLQSGVNASILLTECWLRKVSRDSEEGKRLERGEDALLRPSEAPDREEALFFMVESPEGNMTGHASITRDGDITHVGELIITPDENHEVVGRLVGGVLNL